MLEIMICHLRIFILALMVARPFSILEPFRVPNLLFRISLLFAPRYWQRIFWPRDYRVYVAEAYIID